MKFLYEKLEAKYNSKTISEEYIWPKFFYTLGLFEKNGFEDGKVL